MMKAMMMTVMKMPMLLMMIMNGAVD